MEVNNILKNSSSIYRVLAINNSDVTVIKCDKVSSPKCIDKASLIDCVQISQAELEECCNRHLQLKWVDETNIENKLLESTMKRIKNKVNNDNLWNNSILDMIRLYFVDMKKIFRVLYKKMKSYGKIYFNVSNSAYFNELIDTLEICASIAEDEGFNIIEIRDARKLKSSPQQKKDVGYLLEGIIVMEK